MSVEAEIKAASVTNELGHSSTKNSIDALVNNNGVLIQIRDRLPEKAKSSFTPAVWTALGVAVTSMTIAATNLSREFIPRIWNRRELKKDLLAEFRKDLKDELIKLQEAAKPSVPTGKKAGSSAVGRPGPSVLSENQHRKIRDLQENIRDVGNLSKEPRRIRKELNKKQKQQERQRGKPTQGSGGVKGSGGGGTIKAPHIDFSRLTSGINQLRQKLMLKAKRLAVNFVLGLTLGIGQRAGEVKNETSRTVQAIPETAGKELHTRSPSRVMMRFGRFAAEGLAAGIGQGQPKVVTAARKMVAPIPQEARSAVSGLKPLNKELAATNREATQAGRNMGTATKGMRGLGPAGKIAGGGLKAVGKGFRAALGPAGLILMLLEPFIGKLIETVTKSKAFKKAVEVAMKGVSIAIKWVTNAAKSVFNWVKSNWKKLLPLLLGPFGLVITGVLLFKKRITGAIGAAIGWIKGNWKKVLAVLAAPFIALPVLVARRFSQLGRTLRSKGADLINGFIEGIKSRAGAVISTIKGFVTDKIPGFMKKALGIRSPSVVMMGLGRSVSEGMALGIADGGKKIDAAMEGIVPGRRGIVVPKVPALAGVGAGVRGGGLHIENYYESQNGSVRATAEELMWLAKGRG